MCGIVGKIYFGRHGKVPLAKEKSWINSALEKIGHRGPDDSGYVFSHECWLGSARLSIIDLSPAGHQPMQNDDKSVSLVLNGEIYNYLELGDKLRDKYRFRSNTDTEVVLRLYEEYGVDCLRYLRGMFAFAIWDSRKQILFLARDRIGQKPLKYFYNDKFLIFASELKAFIGHPGVPKEIDWQAVDQFLTYQYVPSPGTGFKNIRKLPPAHYMIVRPDGTVSVRKYWDLDFSKKKNCSEKEWMTGVENKLNESIKLRLRSDVPLGFHLSGGVDSGLITALAAKQLNHPIDTFSIGFDEKEYDELPYSRLVAEKYNTNHHEFVVKPDIIHLLPELAYQYEEPFADPSILPTWYLMKETKKHVTVALNGDGGDENFAGYMRYKYSYLINGVKFIPIKSILGRIFKNINKTVHLRKINRFMWLLNATKNRQAEVYDDLMSILDSPERRMLYSDIFNKYLITHSSSSFLKLLLSNVERYDDVLDKLLYADLHSYLPEYLMVKIDISSMAHSLEARSPFLDHEFMELEAKMPANLKVRNFQTKYILRKIARKYLPKECVDRKKQGFIPPLDIWFRGELVSYLETELSDRKFLSYNIFKPERLRKMIKEHRDCVADNSYALFTILMLKHWLETWFENLIQND
ncbi:asparagine synthase (glutamine-hydrolyzing) [Patescibacteria group bacterium]|nr:asparagine synthase (glutamine-hydrolyzing) [Patescibacteria group bacterium]